MKTELTFPVPFPQFLELLRSGLWNKAPQPDGFAQLTLKDWNKLLLLAQQQGVVALVGHAVQQLPQEVLPPIDLLLQWIGYTHTVQSTHSLFQKTIAEVLSWFEEANIPCGVFKGDTMNAIYPIPNLRSNGDVDLWFPENDGVEKATRVLEERGLTVTPDPHHALVTYQHVAFELHPDCMNLPFKIRIPCYLTPEDSPYYRGYRLNEEADTVMLLTHAAHHFLETGLGLRHLCDWAVWLHHKGNSDKVMCGLQEIKRLGAGVFLTEFTALAVDLLGLDNAVAHELTKGSKPHRSMRILLEMLQQGNLGKRHLNKKRYMSLPAFYMKSLQRELSLSFYWKRYVWASIPYQFKRSMRLINKQKKQRKQ